MALSDWADRNRKLSREASAEPGQWRTSRAEYQRGILDAVTDRTVHSVAVMTSAQVGKSEVLLNALGYYISQDPSPILLLQPTLEMAEAFSKDRLAPMLRDTPVLKDLVADPRARDSGNTLLHKQFPGGHVTMAGANSPSSLASRPVRIVMCDEVDRYPPSAGSEGDPVTLAKARAKTFWNRKLILTSTPTIKGHSRIEAAYQESDRRRYWVPCPHCGERQTLVWSQVRWDQGDAKSALYYCAHCGVGWTDAERYAAIRKGEWRAEAPFTGVAGFHLNELYSPWSRITDIVTAFLDVKASRSAERMRAWQNTVLGECWEDAGETIDETGLMERAETWDGEPQGVLFKTLGVDVQDDRLELELVGWGLGEESWSLRYDVIFGDPSAPALWADLARYIADWRPSATAVDTGGHYTQQAYAFCRNRLKQRVYAIKGMAGPGRPVWPKKASKQNVGKVNLFLIGVDAAKEVVYSRLKIKTPGPGYCHFPRDRDDQYFAGLASEMVVTRYSKGFPIREWRKRKGGLRNEPLDCRVYAYAAMCSFGTIHWNRLRKPAPVAPQVEEVAPPEVVVAQAQRPMMRRVRRGGFVKSW
jgi:phage terminase large subunit GpA-like protein